MSNEEAIDYFDTEAEDYPLIFREKEYRPGEFDRGIEVYGPDNETRPLTIDDAAAAIAGVIHLWRKPDEDLHGYTRYVDEARSFLTGVWQVEKVAETLADNARAHLKMSGRNGPIVITPNPDNGPDFARHYGDCDVAAVEEGRASIEKARGRSLEEILGQ